MKILNLYAGIGGNRKKWPDHHDVVAVEKSEEIADIYQDHFPQDEVIVADAHKYLLEHYDEFEFIWASPPCPTHSKMRKVGVEKGQYPPKFPDMKLYEEILFLQAYFEGDFVVENVQPFYEPLIKPQRSGRHLFWSSFNISNLEIDTPSIHDYKVAKMEEAYGFDLSEYSFSENRKDKVLKNCVHPDLGLHVLKSRSEKQSTLQEVELA